LNSADEQKGIENVLLSNVTCATGLNTEFL